MSAVTRRERLTDFDLPWCQQLLNAPGVIVYNEDNMRLPPPDEKGSHLLKNLMTVTLNTDQTIPAYQLFWREKTEDSPETCCILASLEKGVTGHGNLCHGGITSLLLDQVSTITVHRELVVPITVEMRVRFKGPIPVPSIVLVEGQIASTAGQDGHKKRVNVLATIKNEAGKVLAQGDGIFADGSAARPPRL